VSDEVTPVAPVGRRDRRAAERRTAERRAGSASRGLVPAAPAAEAAAPPARPAPPPAADAGGAVFAAQLMGQSGQRRGLKGGPPVLDAARAAYLETRWSGPADRRPKPGRTEDTDI
jgi:hypothetical protein